MPLSRFWRIAKISAEAICLAGRANRRFKLHKRSQLLIRAHNVTLSVVAMGVSNPDRPPFAING
jgi:hypothetical protein